MQRQPPASQTPTQVSATPDQTRPDRPDHMQPNTCGQPRIFSHSGCQASWRDGSRRPAGKCSRMFTEILGRFVIFGQSPDVVRTLHGNTWGVPGTGIDNEALKYREQTTGQLNLCCALIWTVLRRVGGPEIGGLHVANLAMTRRPGGLASSMCGCHRDF